MDREVIQSILNENRRGYNQIAEKFSQTRRFPWSEFKHFEPYVKPSFKILDVGCGSGRLYNFLANKKITYQGLDSSKKLIKIASSTYPQASFQIGDINALPFDNNSFDLVFCIATLHHIPGQELRNKAVSEMARALKPGGYLLMTNWNLLSGKMWPTLARFTLKKIIGSSQLDWMDIQKPWKDNYGVVETSRYLHAFIKSSLKKLLQKHGFAAINQYYTARELKTGLLSGYNLVTTTKKS